MGLAIGLISPVIACAQPDAPPTPEQAMAAYERVEGWIRAWELPGDPPENDFDIGGASVMLRLNGEMIGRGAATGGRRALWQATRDAWIEATGKLPVERDILAQRNAQQLAADVLISLELAGPSTPMLADGMAQLLSEYNPGIHGLAVQIGNRTRAIFPGAMLAMSDTPADALRKVLLDLFDGNLDRLYGPTLDFRSPRELRERDGAVFLRFRVTHISQTQPGGSPVFLHRGGRIVELHHLSVEGIREWADGMASHLALRAWPGSEPFGMAGAYNPISGESRPLVASPTEQALVALALRRYARLTGLQESAADRARAFAYRILSELAVIDRTETDPAGDAASAAMFILAYYEGGRPPLEVEQGTAQLFASCSAAVRSAFAPEAGFAADVPRAAYGPIAWAMLRLAHDGVGSRVTANAAINAAFELVSIDQLVMHMPWLGFAAMESGDDILRTRASALRDMRTLVHSHQITAVDLDPLDRDFAGGIVFTRGQTPLPTWQSARPMAFLPAMLRDSRLTPTDARSSELVRILAGLRFLLQLTAEDATLAIARTPARARWGVRSALWDQRMPGDATALTLITVCETIRTIDAMRQAP